MANNRTPNPPVLFVEFDEYSLPVVFPTQPMKDPEGTIQRHRGTVSQPTKAGKIMGMHDDIRGRIDKLIATGMEKVM